MNPSAKPNNATKVSNLIRRYEELTSTSRIRPYFRRWMSTNTNNLDSKGKKSRIAQRIDKVGIPRNKPLGNGYSNGVEDQVDGVELKLGDGKSSNDNNASSYNSESDLQNPSERDLLNFSEGDLQKNDSNRRPIKAARSIEDFEDLIYFNEKAQEEKVNDKVSVEGNAANSAEGCISLNKGTQKEQKINDSSEESAENAVEIARRKAKDEEERYRRSIVDDDQEEEEELDVLMLISKDVKADKKEEVHEEKNEINNNIEVNESKPNVKRDKKEFVIDELINTERIYIQNLELVIRCYLQYLKQQRYKSEWIRMVFSNIESIHEHTQVFLMDLEDCKYNYAEIGKVFCKHRELFDKYPKYCKDRKRSHLIITTELKEIVAHLQIKLGDKLGLNSSLLKPIQRLAKYELLLINLNNLLLKDEMDVTSLKNAITLIQRVAKIADTMVTLNTLKRCPYNYNDIGPLLLQNEFKLLSPEKLEAMVFLFEKMVIVTEIVAVDEEYNFRYLIPLDALRFNRPKNGSVLVLENFSRNNKAQFSLESKDLKVLNTWTEKINNILWDQLNKFKGKVQNENFQASLNHFKRIDTMDNIPKPSKTAVKGILKKSGDRNYPSKPAQSEKVTTSKPSASTKSKSGTKPSSKSEPAKSKNPAKSSNHVDRTKAGMKSASSATNSNNVVIENTGKLETGKSSKHRETRNLNSNQAESTKLKVKDVTKCLIHLEVINPSTKLNYVETEYNANREGKTNAPTSTISLKQAEASTSSNEAEAMNIIKSSDQTDAVNTTRTPNQAGAISATKSSNQAEAKNTTKSSDQADAVNTTKTPNKAEAIRATKSSNQAEAINIAKYLNQAEAMNTKEFSDQAKEINTTKTSIQIDTEYNANREGRTKTSTSAKSSNQTEATNTVKSSNQAKAMNTKESSNEAKAINTTKIAIQTGNEYNANREGRTKTSTSTKSSNQTEATNTIKSLNQAEAINTTTSLNQAEANNTKKSTNFAGTTKLTNSGQFSNHAISINAAKSSNLEPTKPTNIAKSTNLEPTKSTNIASSSNRVKATNTGKSLSSKSKNVANTESTKSSTFYAKRADSPAGSNKVEIKICSKNVATSKITSAKLNAVKSSSKIEERQAAKKLEKEKDTRRKLDRRMAMIHRM